MCCVVGVYGVEESPRVLMNMMKALHYRGEQSCGMTLFNANGRISHNTSLGPVQNLLCKIDNSVFSQEWVGGIGHGRYGTTGDRSALKNAQPLGILTQSGEAVYIAHNGDTPNFDAMKRELVINGALFQSDSDTEIILKNIERAREENVVQAILRGIKSYAGTYALTILARDQDGIKLIAARDPFGNRPLAIGTLGNGYVIASENSAFESVGAQFLRELLPGEMAVISSAGIKSCLIDPEAKGIYQCIFELIYFSFPSSKIFGVPVWKFREELGKKSAELYGHYIKDGDVVDGVPDSANYFADGFCNALRSNRDRVFIRRHSYEANRSFTQPNFEMRNGVVREKFSIVKEKVDGRRVWILDDSIVRGITSKRLIRALRANGARFVGVLIGSPPLIGPCRKGIDLDDLIAAPHTSSEGLTDVAAIRETIEADFLRYLSLEDLRNVITRMGMDPRKYCYGCFQNREPIWNVW